MVQTPRIDNAAEDTPEDIADIAAKFQADNLRKRGHQPPGPSGGIGGQKKALFLFVLTAAYLVFELAFNARLLDVIGTSVDEHDIDNIEFWGRMISGCALTLGLWSFAIKENEPLKASLGIMALVAGACFVASYVIQERILFTISSTATPAEKRAAAMLVISSEAIHSDDATLTGMDFDNLDRGSPEFKTFMALFPALALYTDNVEDKTKREVRNILRAKITNEMGGAQAMLDAYFESEVAIKEAYNSYYQGTQKAMEALASIPREQQRAYRDYRNALGRYTPDTLPRSSYSRVRRDVQAAGVNVPYDWDPRDKKTFYDVIDDEIRTRARRTYEREMLREADMLVDPGKSFPDFVADERVQSKWRQTLSISANIRLQPLQADLTPAQFQARIYEPWVSELVEREAAKLLAPVETFEDGGRNQDTGDLAIRIAFVPFVAFAFSIAGALFHIVKTSWLASKSVRAPNRIQALVCVVALGGTLWLFIPSTLTQNEVTTAELYTKLEADAQDKAGPLIAKGIRSLIQFQPAFYPMAEWLRTVPLMGIRFGVAEAVEL